MHRHTWTVTASFLLSLPTCDGLSERYCEWHCADATCDAFLILTGEFRLGIPLGTPEQWQVIADAERREGGTMAKVVAQNERTRIASLRYPHRGDVYA